MAASRRPRSRQPELFARSKRSVIEIALTHRLVMITEETDWTELEELIQAIRRSKLKNEAGRPPHLRAMIGAVMFRALRKSPTGTRRIRFGTTRRRATSAG
jgi:hypothetical protein